MNHVIAANKHAWAVRNKRGQYAPSQKFWPVFLAIPVIAAMAYLGRSLPSQVDFAPSTPTGYEEVTALPCPNRQANGVCDLTDPAVQVKWDKWEKSPMKVLSDVCAAKGLAKDKKCPVVLAAMARQESTFGKNMVGDGGAAKGWFQINATWHAVPKSCSYDLKCSAEWTLNRMIGKGYKKNWEVAVQSHNGTPGIPATRTYLKLVKHWMVAFVPSLYKI